MRTEDEIAALFDEAVQDLDPAVDVIVGRAERQGRRMRARRTACLTAGNALAVAAIVGVSIVIAALGRPAASPAAAGTAGGGQAAGAAAGASAASGAGRYAPPKLRPVHPKAARSSAAASGHRPPKSAPGTDAPAPLTLRQIMATLRATLPAGSTISNVRRGLVGESVEFDYNDGKGAVDFVLDIAPASMSKGPLACPRPPWNGNEGPRPDGALPISCVVRTLADGSVERDWVTGADVMSFYAYNIWLIKPGGVAVLLQVGNGIIDPLPQVSRAVPPGSMAEWTALVESPAWHL